MSSYSFPDLTSDLITFRQSGLAVSPWLAGASQDGRFDPGIFDILDSEAREYAAVHWTEDLQYNTFGDLPIPERLPRTALYETMASTAVFTAHEIAGKTMVDENIAFKTIDIVEDFSDRFGFARLVEIYSLIASYENQSALAYYGRIPEKEFLKGSWHRPWIDYSLNDEFILGTLAGNYRVVPFEGRRYVELTDRGHLALKRAKSVLETSGYLAQRVSLLHISQFGLYKDYESLAETTWPNLKNTREKFLAWAGIEPGMKVLEIGCGSGSLTFEAGLAELIGPAGHVVAIDPSAGMLARAKSKNKSLQFDWVDFQQSRVEQLPFPDGAFDAVIGSLFLHLTDLPLAITEMTRVTRSNGIIASFHPLKIPLNVPFFAEWFSPILELAAQRNEPPKEYLLPRGRVQKAFASASLTQIESQEYLQANLFLTPDQVIRHFIYGVGWFQEELADLPWKARMEVLDAVTAKGQEVCSKYTTDQRVLEIPGEMVKGRVKRT